MFCAFPTSTNYYLRDDITRLHAYSNHQLCLFFTSKHPARIPTGTDTNVQREKKSKRCPRAQRIWDEKGYYLTVGWAVWRRSYLNRNAIAASSGLGLSESVETAQGWRRIAESYHKEWYGARDRDVVIDDGCKGRAQCFYQLNRFVCSFIAHLPGLLRSIILVRFWTSVFPHTFIFRSFECFLMLLLLQCHDPIPQTRSLLFHFCCYRKRTVLALLLGLYFWRRNLS